jgi:hypothetical protein
LLDGVLCKVLYEKPDGFSTERKKVRGE